MEIWQQQKGRKEKYQHVPKKQMVKSGDKAPKISHSRSFVANYIF